MTRRIGWLTRQGGSQPTVPHEVNEGRGAAAGAEAGTTLPHSHSVDSLCVWGAISVELGFHGPRTVRVWALLVRTFRHQTELGGKM